MLQGLNYWIRTIAWDLAFNIKETDMNGDVMEERRMPIVIDKDFEESTRWDTG